jgi:UPF0716 protein FxsA
MPLVALMLVFLVLPVAELYVIYQVGDAIGIWWTLALLALDSLVGSLLLRSQGRAAWHRLQRALERGRLPHREVQDGVLVIFGGALLITPGFITDVLGLLLLFPPTRAPVRRQIMRTLARRAADRVGKGVWDVEGSATEVDVPPRPLER